MPERSPLTTPSSSLFTDARESLDALANDAATYASDQGIDTVGSLADEVRKALDAGETYARLLREVTGYALAPEMKNRIWELIGHGE